MIMFQSTVRQSSALRGIFLLLVAMLIFSIQDIIVKLISSDYALLEIVVIRSIFALPFVLLVLHFNGGMAMLRTESLHLHLLRGFSLFLAYTFFFLGLAALPYSLSVALFFAGPLFITALSVPLLGERVGWRRWLAVLIGFGGVVTVIQPGAAGFDPAAIFAVAAALVYAISIILTRKMNDSAPAMAVYTTLCYLTLALIFSPVFASFDFNSTHPSLIFLTKTWTFPLLKDVLLIFIISLCWGTGMVLLSAAYRDTPVATLAPFEYFAIFYGIIFGFIIWREVPSLLMMVGVALIVSSGLFIIYRENRLTE